MAIFNMVYGSGGGGSIPNYLCFTANTAGSTVQLKKNGTPYEVELEISVDGINWSTYTIGSTITLSNLLDKIYFRNKSETDTNFNKNGSNYYQFVMSGSISGSGDINYLLNKNSTNTLSSNCYRWLFRGCSSLVSSPELPATTLADSCYHSMFRQCTGLISMPELPATTLAEYCCYGMFYGCTSLVNISEFKATNLANWCYYNMFSDCTNLEKIPKLPATTLKEYCYGGMFNSSPKIKLSTTQTGAYQTAYRIPTTGTGTDATNAFINMLSYTGGTFTGTPTINTTYYTSNTVV